MAQKLGVVILEKDLSKSAAALPVPAGAIAGYSVKGPTDKAYLCRSEDDIRRLFGQPSALMTDGGISDLNRGLHNAFRFVRQGLPVYFKRAIPSTVPPVNALSLFQMDTPAAPAADSIKATAKGHGDYYEDLSILVGGIESVRRQVIFTSGAGLIQDLQDNVLPGTLKITSAASSADTCNDKSVAVYGIAIGGTKVVTTTLLGATTVKYEDTTTGTTILTATSVGTAIVEYERTTAKRVVRVYICDDGETDPINNNYENFLVSYKPDGTDEAGKSCYILDVINGVSELVDIAVGSTYDSTVLPLSYLATAFSGGLGSGTNGTYDASDSDVKTAYDVFDNAVLYDILYIFDAGYDDSVKKEIADICARRIFPHAYLDPDIDIFLDSDGNTLLTTLDSNPGAVVDKLVDWRMGIGNKEFASLAGSCWGLITDEFNGGRKLWMGPTYEVGALAVTVDNTLGSWNSVMGPRRGVTNFEKLAVNLYDYRDELNVKQVNPLIIDERGIQMFYGNKTLKTTASAMQQSHARKTRGRISREMYLQALDYVAEPLVTSTYNDLQDDLDNILNQRYGQALESYSLVVGPPATTQDDINNQTLRIKVGLIFNQIAEEIIIEVSVFKNGTDLSITVL